MRLLKVASAALNQTPLDWANNKKNIRDAISEAKQKGVELLLLPELCITGYGCEDLFNRDSVLKAARECLIELAKEAVGITVVLGLPIEIQNKIYNGAAVISNGKIQVIQLKQHLAGDGIHYEPRWFKAWEASRAINLQIEKDNVLVGDVVFTIDGIRYGIEMCEDAWVANRTGRNMSQRNVDVILNPSASHFAFNKSKTRANLVVEASRAFHCAYVYSNLLGNEAGRVIYDGDCIIATQGQIVSRGRRFSFKSYQLTTAVVDISANRHNARKTWSHATVPTEYEHHIYIKIEKIVNRTKLIPTEFEKQYSWEDSSDETFKAEEFARAVALGLWDYLRKSRMNGFMISLSGGADSTSVCLLARIMIDLAHQELGSLFFEMFPQFKTIDEAYCGLINTVYLPTENSSKETENSAGTIAKALGARFRVIPINEVLYANTRGVETYLGRTLTWEYDDITLQNLQARSRPAIAWGIANLLKLLFLNTSNRSEAAVGYTTMDGDSSGCINPIGGINKDFLLDWLRFMERHGIDGLEPFPALKAVNSLQPSAELRPLDQKQTDEEDLMPYPVLNRIEHFFAVEGKGALDICCLIHEEFPIYSKEKIGEWVRKFFVMCPRAQWKRERLAISFHLDDHNLDPKTWFRFPILMGPFNVEFPLIDSWAGLIN